MARYLQYLVTQARRESENEEFSSTNGIVDAEFIQYFNDAQHRLQSLIVAQRPSVFTEEKILNTVVEQESYTLPADIFLENMVSNIEYSTGPDFNYYILDAGTLKDRNPGVFGLPRYYIRKNSQVLLSPIPQRDNEKIRVNYVRRVSELDLRRGSVASVTLGTDTITSLTLNTGDLDSTDLDEHNYLCVIDRDGNFKMKNIPYDGINPGTGVVTVSSGFTFDEGETIEVSDYICGGKETTTHSELPRHCERYLIKYTVNKILMRDSSIDVSDAFQELTLIENDIVESYSSLTDDVINIPEVQRGWWGINGY